jgi:hypothetical protein
MLLWAAQLSGLLRFKRTPAMWQQALFMIAAAGALSLIILSRSGHAAVALAATVAFAAIGFFRARATHRAYLALIGALVALPLILLLAGSVLLERTGGATFVNSSWEARSESMVVGFNLWAGGGLSAALFGVGPGVSAILIEQQTGLAAVWSVSLTYIYETGLLGLLAACGVGYWLMSVWRATRFDWIFQLIAIVWLVGITITTSYGQLLPQWVTLGLMLVWPSVCTAPVEASSEVMASQNAWTHLRGKRRTWRDERRQHAAVQPGRGRCIEGGVE